MDQMGGSAIGDGSSTNCRVAPREFQSLLGHRSNRKGKIDMVRGAQVGDLGTSRWLGGALVGRQIENSLERVLTAMGLNRPNQSTNIVFQLGKIVGLSAYRDPQQIPARREVRAVNGHDRPQTSAKSIACNCTPDLASNDIAHMGKRETGVDQHTAPKGVRANMCSLP